MVASILSMLIKHALLASAAVMLVACADADDGGEDTLTPGVCGDGVLNLGEACDVPDADGCDADCHITGQSVWTVTRGESGTSLTYPLDVAVGPDGQIVALMYAWGGASDPPEGSATLVALAPSGETRWTTSVQSPGGGEGVAPSHVAIGPDGSIFFHTFGVACYDGDGQLVWDEPTQDLRTASALALAGDDVYVASYGLRDFDPNGPSTVDASLRRHDPATGEIVWERVLTGVTDVGRAISITVAGDTVVAAGQVSADFPNDGSAFACASAATGALVPCLPGRFTTIAWLVALPSGDVVFATSDEEHEFLRSTSLTGEVRWDLALTADMPVIRDIAVGPDATIALAGYRGGPDASRAALRLLDSDGALAWDLEVPPTDGVTQAAAGAVAFGPGFLVMAGQEGPGFASTAWISRIGP